MGKAYKDMTKAELLKALEAREEAEASAKLKITFKGNDGDYAPTVEVALPGRRSKRFGRKALRLAEVALSLDEVQAWLGQEAATKVPFVVPKNVEVKGA